MTAATCHVLSPPTPIWEREEQPDRFVELLENLADLRVAVIERRRALSRMGREDDPRVRQAITQLDEMGQELAVVAGKAAALHQALQHDQLI
jgi:hypothetical protein